MHAYRACTHTCCILHLCMHASIDGHRFLNVQSHYILYARTFAVCFVFMNVFMTPAWQHVSPPPAPPTLLNADKFPNQPSSLTQRTQGRNIACGEIPHSDNGMWCTGQLNRWPQMCDCVDCVKWFSCSQGWAASQLRLSKTTHATFNFHNLQKTLSIGARLATRWLLHCLQA